MRLRRYLVPLAIGILLGAAGRARAQSASGQASASAGGGAPTPSGSGGIRLGDTFRLRLSMGVGFSYDSNLFYEAQNTTSAFSLNLMPSIRLTNEPRLGPRQITFELYGGLGYIEYLTSNKTVQDHRQFNVNAGVVAGFFNLNPYNFSLFDNYVRTTQPAYTISSPNLNRDTNEVGTRINLSPGGGRLTFNVGYLFGIDYFEIDTLKDYDLQYHRFDLRASWRFLPKTALYLAANEIIYHYPHPGTSQHPDSFPLRIDAGIQGLITAKLTVNAWIGYGNGFYQWPATVMGAHPNPNSVIGGLSLSWKPTLLSTGTVGYQHDFQNSLLGAYYDEDMVYVSWTQLVWKFTGFIRFQYTNERFSGVQMIQATTDGTDNLIVLNTRVDYPFKDWLIASLGYDLLVNKSNRTLVTMGATAPGTVPVDYLKNVVYLSLTFQY
jgi:hypothetical protein